MTLAHGRALFRDFKIQPRDGNENVKKWFNQQNKIFARAAHFFVYFFAVLPRLRRESGYGPLEFNFRKVRQQFTK